MTQVPKLERRLEWPKHASSWSWTDVRMAAAGRASPVLIPGRSVPQTTEAQLGFVKQQGSGVDRVDRGVIDRGKS